MTLRLRLATAAAAAFAGAVLFVLELDDPTLSVARLSLMVGVGLVMVAAGLLASANGEDRLGELVGLAGAAWLLERLLQANPTGLTVTTGYLLTGLWGALLFHAIVTYPTGRLASRLEGAVVTAGYAINVGLALPELLVYPDERNLLLLSPSADAARQIGNGADVLTLGWLVVMVGFICAKAWAASPAARRAYGFVWVTGFVLSVNGLVVVGAGLGIGRSHDVYGLWLEIIAIITAVTLAVSLFATRVAEDRLVALVADLETLGPGARLRNALSRALADPGLDLVYLRAGSGGWINEVGQPTMTPVAVGGRALTPIERNGKRVAALIHDPVLLRNPERLNAALGAAALAIDNEQLKAELRAQVLELRASRHALRDASSRLLSENDRERRRIARDLHDGLQVSLVRLSMQAHRLARDPPSDSSAALAARLAGEVDEAASALRAIVNGVMPAPLVERGLAAAVQELAYDLPVRTTLDVGGLPARLPAPVESTAYFVAAEALTNVIKHADARNVDLYLRLERDVLSIDVVDDGRGGVPGDGSGSGLSGLRDRVEVLGGTLMITSGATGTRVHAVLPCVS